MASDLKLPSVSTTVAIPVDRAAMATEGAARAQEEYVVRFDPHQRLQHLLMMSSFIVLAVTGLPQKFDELAVSQAWVSVLGGLEMARLIHRCAAVVMLGDCLYHLAYLGYRIGVQKRMHLFRMLPSPKDARDAFGTILYFVGIASAKPKFDRYSYLEKFDYWAVFWGIAVIGGSGLVLMFPVLAARLLLGQVTALALTLHGDEAILAVGWIMIMHIFNVHLAPWAFPMNPSIFTGKLRAERYREEHALEWERIRANGHRQDSGPQEVVASSSATVEPPPAGSRRRATAERSQRRRRRRTETAAGGREAPP